MSDVLSDVTKLASQEHRFGERKKKEEEKTKE